MAAVDPVAPSTMAEGDLRRAGKWLAQHGAGDRAPSRLLAARLAVRDRRQRAEQRLLLALAALLAGFVLLRQVVDIAIQVGGRDLVAPVSLAAFYLLTSAGIWLLSRRQRAREARIAARLPRRAARSAVEHPVAVLGGAYLAAASITYLGGTGLGLGFALLSADPVDRALGLVFAVGTALVGAIAGVVAWEETRRPAVAEDDASLMADDLLRRQDAHRVAPFTVAVALAFSASAHGTGESLTLLTFTVLTAALWVVSYVMDHRRKLPAPGTAAAR